MYLPPSYSREVWDYKNANVVNSYLLIWEKAFENLSINEKVNLLNNTLFNIFCKYIPNKLVNCSYRNSLWITKQIKSKLRKDQKSIIGKAKIQPFLLN